MYCRSYYLLCLLFLSSSGSGRPTKITRDVLSIVEAQMQADDETTAVQLQKLLVHVDNGHPLSLKTILASHEKLGWTFRGSTYCHLIRHQNKLKRLQWAKDHLMKLQTTDLMMWFGRMSPASCWKVIGDFAVVRKVLRLNLNQEPSIHAKFMFGQGLAVKERLQL